MREQPLQGASRERLAGGLVAETSGKPAGSGEFRQNWRSLVGSMMGASVGTVGIYSYTAGTFVAPLTGAGFSPSQLSLASLVLNAVIALSAPVAGFLMDRHGALKVISLCVVGEAIGFTLLGWTPVNFYFFAAGVALLALLGVGTTPPGFARIVAGRFDSHRGLALGIMICGPGLMAITAPIWVTGSVEWAGWRAAYWCIAAAVLAIGGLGAALIHSDRDRSPRGNAGIDRPKGDWTALRRPIFWLLLVAFVAPALFAGGYLFHMISILRDRGFTSGEAAQVQSLIGVAIVVGRLSSGALIDRFPAQRVAAIVFIISAFGCLMLLSQNSLLLCIAALAMGLTIGAELDILAYLISRYFGIHSFGRLYALSYSALMLGSGASAPLIISLFQTSGSSAAFVISAIGTSIGAIVLLLMPPAPRAASRS